MTADPETLAVLREIRDLQAQLVASHKEAMAIQREAIGNQREALDRQKNALRRVLPLFLLLMLLLIYGPWLYRWVRYLMDR